MYRVNTKTCQRENVSVADYCKNRLGATENKQLLFLAEVGNHCPLCGRYLLKQTSHSVTKLYEIAVNGNQKCSDFGNSECSIFGIKTTVLLASAVQ